MNWSIERVSPLNHLSSLLTFCTLLSLLAYFAPIAKADDNEDLRNRFLLAEKAFKQGKVKEYQALRQQLNDYPLAVYLDRDELLSQFSITNTPKIDAFLEAYGDQPVSRKLRYRWLNWLAKHNYGSQFLKHFQDMGSPSLSCHQLNFRLRTDEQPNDIFAAAETIWLTGRSLPSACDSVFKQWKQLGGPGEDLTWQRLILAVKANQKSLASYLARSLSTENQAAASLMLKVAKRPETLGQINFKTPLSDKAQQIIAFGLNRLAWQRPEKTIAIWQRLGEDFQYQQSLPAVRQSIALSLAIDKHPAAREWLSNLTDRGNTDVEQWLLSTTIQAADWQGLVDQAIELIAQDQLSDHQENKWRYWQAVAESHLGQTEDAHQRFAELAKLRGYYGFLAARQINRQPQLSYQPVNMAFDTVQAMEMSAPAKRAKEFYHLNRFTDARREWNALIEQTPEADQIKLALLAHSWNWRHQAILAFARSKQIDDLGKRFPLDYYDIFKAQATKQNIPLTWTYAITRQESAFKADARSSANARGLMQLTPATARQVATKTRLKNTQQLYVAETNIELGTAHLARMYRDFDQQPVLATAAYNAGQRRVRDWLKKAEYQDPIQWIEQIPYRETREYVKNVLTYQLIYAQLTDQSESFLSQLAERSGVAQNIDIIVGANR